ncbi:tetratricopeptide repeat protein [Rikenella microfusus]|uniref:Predicted O-linked N-acetylglucosamine transferase, SPINDLY family n=1 Tax=Rikenella microfusus TaxID=28139 RepID=A0A379MR78_9BACT|nr:tetratricopeptide repeat protein [Rikenella microfusus]SUE33122.1 Predicted O-linked N-acetylglucosamine transferase, SPINDLY family [Rikenella microfusus]
MKQVKLWGVALAAALTVLGASAQTKEEVGLKMKEAGELINNKKLVEAIPVVEEVIKMGQAVGADAVDITSEAQKLLPKLYLQKGVESVRAQKLDEAIAAFEKAENLADLQGDVMTTRQAGRFVSNIYMSIGITSFNAKDYTKALESFQKGLKQDPENIQLAYFTAKSYAEMGQLEQAMELYKQVIAAGTENSKYAKQATDAKADMDNYMLVAASEAAQAGDIEKVQTYVAAVPENADANLLLIQTANNLKKYDVVVAKGADAYAAQTDDAKKSDVAFLIGVAYQNKGNNAKAAEWLRKVTAGSNVAAAKELLTSVTAA